MVSKLHFNKAIENKCMWGLGVEGQVGQYAGEASEGRLLEWLWVVTFAGAGLTRRWGEGAAGGRKRSRKGGSETTGMNDACVDSSSESSYGTEAGGEGRWEWPGCCRGYISNQISRSGKAGVKATGKGLAWEPGSSFEAKVRATTGAMW